jgi:hypothetical protein
LVCLVLCAAGTDAADDQTPPLRADRPRRTARKLHSMTSSSAANVAFDVQARRSPHAMQG